MEKKIKVFMALWSNILALHRNFSSELKNRVSHDTKLIGLWPSLKGPAAAA